MRFFNFALAAAAVPALVLASPVVERAAAPAPAPVVPALADIAATLSQELAARTELADRADLGGILGDLSGTLAGIEKLLSPGDLAAINTVVNNAAKLLSDGNTKTLTSILGDVGGVLNSPIVGELAKALPGLLAALPKLLDGGLFTNLTDIVGNAHDLLDAKMVHDTKGLIEDVYPIVESVSKLLGGLLGAIGGH